MVALKVDFTPNLDMLPNFASNFRFSIFCRKNCRPAGSVWADVTGSSTIRYCTAPCHDVASYSPFQNYRRVPGQKPLCQHLYHIKSVITLCIIPNWASVIQSFRNYNESNCGAILSNIPKTILKKFQPNLKYFKNPPHL